MSTDGYYINCDDALCFPCLCEEYDAASIEGCEETWRAEGGFEDWDSPLLIDAFESVDAPTHCYKCDKLLTLSLTSEGRRYVAEALMTDEGGRPEIRKAWAEEFEEELAREDVLAEYSATPHFDRFDIAEAYYLLAHDLGELKYSVQLARLRFRMAPLREHWTALSPNGRAIYQRRLRHELAS